MAFLLLHNYTDFIGLYRGYSYHNNISIYEFYKYLLENYIWKNPKVLKETVKYFMTKMKNRVKG